MLRNLELNFVASSAIVASDVPEKTIVIRWLAAEECELLLVVAENENPSPCRSCCSSPLSPSVRDKQVPLRCHMSRKIFLSAAPEAISVLSVLRIAAHIPSLRTKFFKPIGIGEVMSFAFFDAHSKLCQIYHLKKSARSTQLSATLVRYTKVYPHAGPRPYEINF
jgi:hypothetical protein